MIKYNIRACNSERQKKKKKKEMAGNKYLFCRFIYYEMFGCSTCNNFGFFTVKPEV